MGQKLKLRETPGLFDLTVGDVIVTRREIPNDSWGDSMRHIKRRRELYDAEYKIITVLPYIIICEGTHGEKVTFTKNDYCDGTIKRAE